MEELTEELLSDLLEINEFDKSEISRAKKAIAQKYNRDVLKNYSLRNRSFSNEKLEKILNDFNFGTYYCRRAWKKALYGQEKGGS